MLVVHAQGSGNIVKEEKERQWGGWEKRKCLYSKPSHIDMKVGWDLYGVGDRSRHHLLWLASYTS